MTRFLPQLLMSVEHTERAAIRGVTQPHPVVIRCRRQHVSGGAERRTLSRPAMPFEIARQSAVCNSPQLLGSVTKAKRKRLPIRAESHTVYRGLVAGVFKGIETSE